MKIAVTGPNGLIGSRIIALLKNDFQFIPLSHDEMDITSEKSVESILSTLNYDLLLHLAAYTIVNHAETEKEKVFKINVEGTRNVFQAVEKRGKKMIYFSTDFIFDGTNPPYDEESLPNPLGYYAYTKYEGEKIVKDKAMIVRISYPYGDTKPPKTDFVLRIKNMLENGKELKMVTDSAITPTFIDDIVFSLKHLMQNYSPEIFHLVGPASISPFEAGKLIARKFNLPENLVKPTTFEEYVKDKAPRPQYSAVKSIKNNFYKMTKFLGGME